MARRMQAAATVPMFTSRVMVDVSRLRSRVQQARVSNANASFTGLLLVEVVRQLKEVPRLTASYDFEGFRVRYPKDIGVGIAVDSPRGLVVPVVPSVFTLTEEQLIDGVADVVVRARAGDRDAVLFSGGAFTITNIAGLGVHGGTPVINVPQVAILGVSTARQVPVVRDGEIRVGEEAEFCLGVDHRAGDGALAAQFLTGLRQALER
jgi:pyruvate/2-oxoglutarate dehydrogenase complex dihydrolipoamide acyltransferase (E2) component